MEEEKIAAVTVCQIDDALEERQHDRRKGNPDITLAVERRKKDRRVVLAEKQS